MVFSGPPPLLDCEDRRLLLVRDALRLAFELPLDFARLFVLLARLLALFDRLELDFLAALAVRRPPLPEFFRLLDFVVSAIAFPPART